MTERDSLRHLSEQVAAQNLNRETWVKNDTPHELAKQIDEEASELVEAIEQFDALPNGEFHIVSEIGDVLYLALKFCHDLGIDPAEAVGLKLLRNSLKYPDYMMSNGDDYSTSRAKAKALWEAMGGDDRFFEAYASTQDE